MFGESLHLACTPAGRDWSEAPPTAARSPATSPTYPKLSSLGWLSSGAALNGLVSKAYQARRSNASSTVGRSPSGGAIAHARGPSFTEGHCLSRDSHRLTAPASLPGQRARHAVRHPTARSGDVIERPVTGERVIWRSVAEDTGRACPRRSAGSVSPVAPASLSRRLASGFWEAPDNCRRRFGGAHTLPGPRPFGAFVA